MNKLKQTQEIIHYLQNWLSKIKLNSCIYYYDINKASEGVSKTILSIVYNLKDLKDLNKEIINYPGIDLGDSEKGICFQISSSITTSKIRETLNIYFDINKKDKLSLKQKYPTLKFFFLTDNEIKFSNIEKKNIMKIDKNFNFNKQILTIRNIMNEIETLYDNNYSQFQFLLEYLKREFGPLKSEYKIQNYFFINFEARDVYLDLNVITSKYLESQKNKYIYTKTFIHRQEISFYDFYTPLSIKSQNKIYSINSVDYLFKSTEKNYISIIGKAGSGKSTLVRYLFLNCIENFYAIPILIELRKLNDYTNSLYDYLIEIIFYNKINNSIINEFFNSGKLLFIFDGFDEINHEKRIKILNEIERFTDTYSNNKFIITSRPGVQLESFQRYKNYNVSPLNFNELEKFIEKQIIIYPDEDFSIKNEKLELRRRILDKIRLERDSIFKDYLSNPLLLSMFILTFEQYPDIPKSKNKFYSNVFETLYQKHDAFTKNSWVRPKLSGLEQNEYESILEKFSFKAFKESKLNFTKKYFFSIIDELKSNSILRYFENSNLLNDFTVAIPIINEDGFEEYCFVHKSLMEYFAANAIYNSQYSTKIKLYENFVKLKLMTTADYNFCSICYELDPMIFKEKVILPLLINIKNELLKENTPYDEKIIFKNYLSMYNYRIELNEERKVAGIARYYNKIDSIYEIINKKIPTSDFFSYFFLNDLTIPSIISKNEDKIKLNEDANYLSDEKEVLFLSDISSDELIDFFKFKSKSNISAVEEVINLYEDINNLISEYENQIKENEANELNFFEL